MPVGDSMKDTVSIGLVDNDILVSSALESMLLSIRAPIDILWKADGGPQALELCDHEELRPQVILTDLQMPGMDGVELARNMRQRLPSIELIGITTFQELYESDVLRQAGISYLAYKSDSVETLVSAIGRAAGNATVAEWQEQSLTVQRMLLTETEVKVLKELVNGYSILSIAAQLNMGKTTVKTHLDNAYKKLGVHNRSAAIRVCVQEGIV